MGSAGEHSFMIGLKQRLVYYTDQSWDIRDGNRFWPDEADPALA